MSSDITKNMPDIIILPNFVYKAMDVNEWLGVGANQLMSDSSDSVYVDTEISRDMYIKVSNKISERISKYDMDGVASLTKNLLRILTNKNIETYTDNSLLGRLLYKFDSDALHSLEILNILDTDYTMSGNTDETYSFLKADSVLFVILHSGFNINSSNCNGINCKFLKDLINEIINGYSIECLYDTDIFKIFLRYCSK